MRPETLQIVVASGFSGDGPERKLTSEGGGTTWLIQVI